MRPKHLFEKQIGSFRTSDQTRELQHEDLAEKARVTADKVAREKLEEANREDKMNIHESRNSDPIQEEE